MHGYIVSVVYQLVMGCDACADAEEHWEYYTPGEVPDARLTYQLACERYGFTVTTVNGEKRALCARCQADEERGQSNEGAKDVT